MLRAFGFFVINVLVVLGLARILNNFVVPSVWSAVAFIIILTLLNWTVIPIFKFLAFPFNFLTLGLVNGIINLIGISLAANLSNGIKISGDFGSQFWTILIISIALSLGHALVTFLTQSSEVE